MKTSFKNFRNALSKEDMKKIKGGYTYCGWEGHEHLYCPSGDCSIQLLQNGGGYEHCIVCSGDGGWITC